MKSTVFNPDKTRCSLIELRELFVLLKVQPLRNRLSRVVKLKYQREL